ncbi:MAG: hypothetical protein A3F16_08425 [Deltaproteobacteria bacterium RIFCSPHIGHO2_12_FULL_43_9]|nr:MAG: hypothetical protein A3F16_08425 [Deltaproteobacteria bacterium RIFCSPHIGHO2_12_FULL_43_9]
MEYERLRSLQKIHRKRLIKSHINRSAIIILSRTTLYVVSLFLIILALQEGVKLTLNYLRTTSFFSLQQIEVYGVNRLTEASVMELASVDKNINILTINLNNVDRRIKKNPWVKSLRLRRILPGTLRITIQEKQAYAVVLYDAPYFITRDGEIIKALSAGEETDLPIISGLASKEEPYIRNALSILNSPEGQKVIPTSQIGELHFEDNRLTFYTISPAIKILGDTRSIKDQLYRLKLVLGDLQNRQLNARQIDLNYSKKVVVKLKNSQ